jgi:hypothetical protein
MPQDRHGKDGEKQWIEGVEAVMQLGAQLTGALPFNSFASN